MSSRKVFLSHSSKDKFLVDPVFRQLRAANAHFDEATFEHGETSATAIFDAISKTEVFALFLSKNSVQSRWVQTEIGLAQHRIFSGRISKVMVFLIDDVEPTFIPEWLRSYVYLRSSSPGAIGASLRAALLTLAIEQDSSLDFFEGRDREVRALKDAISVLQEPPSVITLAGNEGIGRRTLARRVLSDVQPHLVRVPIEIPLRDSEGEVEFYRVVLAKTKSLSVIEFVDTVEAFSDLESTDRTAEIAKLIQQLSDQRQMLFLRGRNAVIQDDGHFPDWLRRLVTSLVNTSWPLLTIISRRMISPPKRVDYKNATFLMVGSLERADSRRLLNLWLKQLKVPISNELADEIVTHVSGHPRNIQIAARLASEFGPARLITERRTFIDAIRQHTIHLIEDIKLNAVRERLLALFLEFDYLSADDLLSAVPDIPEDTLNTEMGFLHDHGLIETDGAYLRFAPYLRDVFDRFDWSHNAEEELSKSRARLLERIADMSDAELMSVSTLDSAILAALVSEKSIENPILKRALLPSHLLRVAREFYDNRDFVRTIELTRRAYEGKGKLSVDAQLECLRLRGLASVRAGIPGEISRVQEEFAKYSEQLAKRNSAFLQGFSHRYEGQMDLAEEEFRKAYKLGGDRNFHVLRELARLCSFREEFDEGEEFARAAYEIAPTPYIIDTLLEILIEKHRSDLLYLQRDMELDDLFNQLEVSAKSQGTSFYQRRRAHFYEASRDRPAALQWAEEAVRATPDHIPVSLSLARVKIDAGDVAGAMQILESVENRFRVDSGNVDRRSRGEFDRLNVLAKIQAEDYEAARRHLTRAKSLPAHLRVKLTNKIDSAEAYSRRT
ncbi:MAG: TIR domain-containing protein [Rhodocyclaceae bacterium]|nr:TIR domain-containing protein [Rhodocyclaceae bacterium]